jgi:hypothetical protein
MTHLLNNLDIPNTRISAIDGSIIDLSSITNLEAPLTNYEKAVTLSHIKAISYLENIDGNYFLVLEDDITLNNISLFNIDIKHIIENAPNFDILLAGFPCQPFSNAGLKKGFDDSRGTLFFDIARIVKHHQPQVIFLENVKAGTVRTVKDAKTFNKIRQEDSRSKSSPSTVSKEETDIRIQKLEKSIVLQFESPETLEITYKRLLSIFNLK